MVQINVRVDDTLDKVITFLADQRHVSKATITRELLDAGKNQLLFPLLADMYKNGKISLKKIVALTGLQHTEVIERLSKLLDDAPITPEIDEYTEQITNKLLKLMKS